MIMYCIHFGANFEDLLQILVESAFGSSKEELEVIVHVFICSLSINRLQKRLGHTVFQ